MKNIFIISILIFSTTLVFAQNEQTRNGKPFLLGVIDEIQSEQLSEKRILNIYLPEGYNKNDTIKYPVIYLLDGSADEDFINIVGLVQFYSFEWMNQIPKSIVF
jgi:enterochelin esterase-like enzyme